MKQRSALLQLRLGDIDLRGTDDLEARWSGTTVRAASEPVGITHEDLERIRESLACSPSLPPDTVRQLIAAVAAFLDHRCGPGDGVDR